MPIVMNIDQPLIAIDIYYVEEKKPQGHVIYHFVQSKEDMDEWLEKGYFVEGDMPSDADPQKQIEKLITAWKRMTWKDYNTVVAQSLKFVGSGENRQADLDPIQFRDLKLKTCLKRWNVVDPANNPVPITPAHIDNMIPEIANEMLRCFERMTEPGEEDLKK